jgi:primase-polymerase (primpol)-like protein
MGFVPVRSELNLKTVLLFTAGNQTDHENANHALANYLAPSNSRCNTEMYRRIGVSAYRRDKAHTRVRRHADTLTRRQRFLRFGFRVIVAGTG